jgi:hypothetical protein
MFSLNPTRRRIVQALIAVLAMTTFAMTTIAIRRSSIESQKTITYHGSSDLVIPLQNDENPVSAPILASSRTTFPMLILQHVPPDGQFMELRQASIASHKRYADVHGYSHRADYGDYVPRSRGWNGRCVNKIHTLLKGVLEEVGKGREGAEWIMYVSHSEVIVIG